MSLHGPYAQLANSSLCYAMVACLLCVSSCKLANVWCADQIGCPHDSKGPMNSQQRLIPYRMNGSMYMEAHGVKERYMSSYLHCYWFQQYFDPPAASPMLCTRPPLAIQPQPPSTCGRRSSCPRLFPVACSLAAAGLPAATRPLASPNLPCPPPHHPARPDQHPDKRLAWATSQTRTNMTTFKWKIKPNIDDKNTVENTYFS